MQRPNVNAYERQLSKCHESRNQELRHERKTEDQRLDGLKKTLQGRFKTDAPAEPGVQAA